MSTSPLIHHRKPPAAGLPQTPHWSHRAFAAALVAGAALAAGPATAEPFDLPAGFQTRTVTTADGARIFVRSSGRGSAVVLIPGFGDTSDMWGPLDVAENLAAIKTQLPMPVLAIGGENPSAPTWRQ